MSLFKEKCFFNFHILVNAISQTSQRAKTDFEKIKRLKHS